MHSLIADGAVVLDADVVRASGHAGEAVGAITAVGWARGDGRVTAGGQADVAVTWDAPFLDTNYTVNVNVLHGSVSHLFDAQIEAVTTTGCTISVRSSFFRAGSGLGYVQVRRCVMLLQTNE